MGHNAHHQANSTAELAQPSITCGSHGKCVVQRHVAEAIAAELAEPSAGRADQVEHVCRLLLAADRYAVSHLRDHCLCCLAVMFERLSSSAAPADVRAVFEVRLHMCSSAAQLLWCLQQAGFQCSVCCALQCRSVFCSMQGLPSCISVCCRR